MQTHRRSIQRIVEDQVRKWRLTTPTPAPETDQLTVITVSREPGSGGKLVAQGIADRLNWDLFHQEVVHQMAESAQVSARLLESLDERGLSMLEDWIASAIQQRHLWPDQYLQHLFKVIGTIGRHGQSVVVGRGANFILPLNKIFRIRVIAAFDVRAQKVSETFSIGLAEAKRRISKTESDRKSFIRKYFHEDIATPLNYDLVINTDEVSIDEAVEAACGIPRLRSLSSRHQAA